jgi:hypothetical protein
MNWAHKQDPNGAHGDLAQRQRGPASRYCPMRPHCCGPNCLRLPGGCAVGPTLISAWLVMALVVGAVRRPPQAHKQHGSSAATALQGTSAPPSRRSSVGGGGAIKLRSSGDASRRPVATTKAHTDACAEPEHGSATGRRRRRRNEGARQRPRSDIVVAPPPPLLLADGDLPQRALWLLAGTGQRQPALAFAQ